MINPLTKCNILTHKVALQFDHSSHTLTHFVQTFQGFDLAPSNHTFLSAPFWLASKSFPKSSIYSPVHPLLAIRLKILRFDFTWVLTMVNFIYTFCLASKDFVNHLNPFTLIVDWSSKASTRVEITKSLPNLIDPSVVKNTAEILWTLCLIANQSYKILLLW